MTAKKRILLVDDEKDLVETLQMALEAKGYEVTSAFDGVDAVKLATSEQPDIIVLDVMMPGKNGYQVCWELKNAEATRKIKIIMLTAKTQESDKFWGHETGADEYVTKPFEIADLARKIAAQLGS